MGSYFLKRLARAVITLLVLSMIVFAAVRVTGDPTQHFAPEDATPKQLARVRHDLGLDKPVYVQYGMYLRDAVKGDFGTSLRYRKPALGLVLQRLPATIQLAFAAFLLSGLFGVLFGVLAALRHGTWLDGTIRLFAVLGQSAPPFWVGIIAILIFGVDLHWLPTNGRMGPSYLIMPAVTLALFSLASILRLTRSAMLETLGGDYVRFLRAKGLSERLIVWKHALRNAFVPVAAVLGIQLAHLIGGAVIVEVVFNWPGVGRLMIEALTNSDFPLIQAGVLVIATCVILINLAVDMSFGLIDRRIKYS
jgi:peptide/nickel transport system permease protein